MNEYFGDLSIGIDKNWNNKTIIQVYTYPDLVKIAELLSKPLIVDDNVEGNLGYYNTYSVVIDNNTIYYYFEVQE